jgi:hypothetical protein
LEIHIYHENYTLIMGSLGLELPQGQRTLAVSSAELSSFFLGLTLCPDSTVLAGSCIFLKTEGTS